MAKNGKWITSFLIVLLMSVLGAAHDAWQEAEGILERIQPPAFPDRDFLITEFGAVADGTADARHAINQAIARAHAAGGGRVIVPEGQWFSQGPIHLLSNVNLHIAKGAVLRFSEEPRHYLPQVLTRWEGTEVFNYSPLIYAYQAFDVALTGEGVIDGNAAEGFGRWRGRQRIAQNRLREMGSEAVPVHQRVFGEGDYLRPSMVQFFGGGRILIEGVTLIDSPFWVLHLVYCDQVVVRNVTVRSPRLNNDGVDIDSSSNVLVEGSRFDTGDDSIVIKSGRDEDGWRVGRPSENIVIRNNHMQGHNALAIGSEMSGGVRNVFMENNQLGQVRSALYFKSNRDRGGIVERVRVRNVQVERAEILLRFRTDYHSHRGGDHPPVFRDFRIEGVTAGHVGSAIEAHGLPGTPIRDVEVRDMEIRSADRRISVDHLQNFTLENVRIKGELLKLPAGD